MRNSKEFKQVKPFRTNKMKSDSDINSTEELVILHVSASAKMEDVGEQITYLYEEFDRKSVTQYVHRQQKVDF